jgi:photosystem II stability/assembly factor-like uncharacterized protein
MHGLTTHLKILVSILLFVNFASAQWVSVNGSGLAEFSIGVSKGDTIIVSTPLPSHWGDPDPGALYRSTNNGDTWSQVYPYGASCLATDGLAIYIPGYVSTDGGTTWLESSQGLPSTGLIGKIVSSKGNGITASNEGLYFSSNHGGSWQKATVGVPPTLVVINLIASPSVALARTDYGTFRSIDGGVTWSLVGSSGALSPILAAGGKFYAYAGTTEFTEFWASTESGATWTKRTDALPPLPYGAYSYAGFASSGDSIFFGLPAYNGGVYLSIDDGRTWRQSNTGLQDWQVNAFFKHNGYLLASTRSGLFRAETKNMLWRSLPISLSGVNRVALGQGVLFADGLTRSTDRGQTWQRCNEGIDPTLGLGAIATVTTKDPFLFVAGSNQWLYRSTDKGITWALVNHQFNNPNAPVLSLAVINGVLFAGVYDEVYRSIDNGNSWVFSSTGMRRNHIWGFAQSQHYIFAATDSGLHRSSDKGITWSPIPFSSGLWGVQAMDVLAAGSKVYVGTMGTNGGIYISTDEGNSWSLANNGLRTTEVYWHFRTIGSRIFATGGSGQVALLYEESVSDLGTTWIPMWQDLNVGISDIVSDSVNAFIATSKGVYRCPLSELTSVADPSKQVPTSFSLGQNYPNPFNPTTTIEYALPRRSHVTLTIFNILGQRVATLINNEIEAGFHHIQFDGSGLASGVYLYRLTAGEFSETRRLIFLR